MVAARIITAFTAATVAKNKTKAANTIRPVSLKPEDGVTDCMTCSRLSRRKEMVGRSRRFAAVAIDDREGDRIRLLAGRARYGDQNAKFAGLIGADLDGVITIGWGRDADDIDGGAGNAVSHERKAARLGLLVENPHCVGVADRPVAQPHEHRIAVRSEKRRQ